MPNEHKGCRKNSRGKKDQLLIDKAILKNCRRRLTNLSMVLIDFGMCKNGWNGPEYIHIDREQHGKLEVLTSNQEVLRKADIKREIFQGDSLSRRLIIDITICDHHDTTVADSKGHKSWLSNQERWMQDQSPALYE